MDSLANYQNVAAVGGQRVFTQDLASATAVLATYPGATVAVYVAASGALATLYSDANGTPLTNPFTANSDAGFSFYASQGSYPLNVTISGAGIATPYTFANVQVPGIPPTELGVPNGVASLDGNGLVPVAQLPVLDYLPLAGGTVTGNLIVSGTATVDGNIATTGSGTVTTSAVIANTVQAATVAATTVTLGVDPALPLQAATKQYVDDTFDVSIGPQGPPGKDAVITNPLNDELVASAGASVTSGFQADVVTAGGISLSLNVVAGTNGSPELYPYPYPNTDGIIFPIVDAAGNLIYGLTEQQTILTPGGGTTQLPAGAVLTGADLSLPGSVTIAGNLNLGGVETTSQLIELPYPNTEGAVQAFLDSNGALIGYFDEMGSLQSHNTSQIVDLPYPNTEGAVQAFLDSRGALLGYLDESGALQTFAGNSADGSGVFTTPVTADTTSTPIPAVAVYQTTDSSSNPQVASQTAAVGALAQTAPAETVLTSSGKNFAPTMNADGSVSFITSRTGRNRRFKMDGTGANQFYEELQNAAAQFAVGAPQLHHILMTGQSLSTGDQGYPPVTTTQPFDNTMFSGLTGMNAQVNGKTGVTLVPLIEEWAVSTNETVANGFADSVTASVRTIASDNSPGLTSYDILFSNSGISGEPYAVICGPTDSPPSGTPSYQEFIAQIQTGKGLATNGYYIPCLVIIHGESDDNASTGPAYYQHLQNWSKDLNAGVQANTSQAGTLPILLAQTSAWAAYAGIPQTYTGLAQLEAAIQFPNLFILVGSAYYLPHAISGGNGGTIPDVPVDEYGSGGAHLIANGYRWQGEQFAKVFRRVFLEGKQWLPLTPLKFTRTGPVVAIDFHVPFGPLVFDTTHVVDPGHLGFEFSDSTSSATIVSVALDPVIASRVNVTLSNVPTGGNKKVSYAYTCTPGANNNGPGQGPRGCLRDSDPEVSYYNSTITLNMLTAGQPYPLWNWCTTFSYIIS